MGNVFACLCSVVCGWLCLCKTSSSRTQYFEKFCRYLTQNGFWWYDSCVLLERITLARSVDSWRLCNAETVGPVKSAAVNYDRAGRSKGTGEVTFATAANATKAIEEFHDREVNGRVLSVTRLGTDVRAARESRGGRGGRGRRAADSRRRVEMV